MRTDVVYPYVVFATKMPICKKCFDSQMTDLLAFGI